VVVIGTVIWLVKNPSTSLEKDQLTEEFISEGQASLANSRLNNLERIAMNIAFLFRTFTCGIMN